MSPEIVEVLKKARELLENKGWTQDAWARDKDGRPVHSSDERAACYCASGAIKRAGDFGRKAIDAQYFLSDMLTVATPKINDDPETEYLHILMLFDFAILAADAA